MKKIFGAMLIAVVTMSLIFAGGSKDTSAKKESGSSRPAWAHGVDEVTGTITVYTTMEETQQDILIELWQGLYPKCNIEIVSDSVGTLATKIRSDGTSGADVVIGGMFAADGTRYHDILQPYTARCDSEQLYHDPSGYYTFYDVQVMCLVVNPNVLKQLGVTVKGYQDLLNPKLKDKIILADPGAASSGWRQLQTVLAVMGNKFDDDKGWNYVEGLMKQSFKTNSSREVYNLVNEGEYAVGLSYESTPAGIIQLGGATMEIVYMSEGNTAMPGGAAIVKNAPNLTAAQAMMDLLSSVEFQNKRAALAGRGSNGKCDTGSLPADSTLKIVPLDYDYLNSNRAQIIDRFNTLWATVKS